MQITMDPSLPILFTALLVVFVTGTLFLMFKQPVLIAYLLCGIALGPQGFDIVVDVEFVNWLGNIGVVLLLFSLGMEIPLEKLLSNWKVSFLATFLQIAGSVFSVWVIGIFLNWSMTRIMLLGFVISLSSTSIVVKLLKHDSKIAQKLTNDVISVTIIQDLAIIPMLLIIGILTNDGVDPLLISKQVIGTISIMALLYYVNKKKEIKLPFGKVLEGDEDMQVFAAINICLGMALLTGFFGLSTALGAFLAGIIIRSSKEIHWIKNRMESFRILFMAIFFVSIGLMIDLKFIAENIGILIVLTIMALLINTIINAVIFKSLGKSWKEGFYVGALLSQISEFSFVLAAVGLQTQIISEYSYKVTIALIAITIFVSPWWASIFRRDLYSKMKLAEVPG